MDRVEQLLDMVDKPGEMKQFRFRQLKYTMAATLKDKVKSLADQLGTISITIAAQPARQPVTTTIQRRPTPGRPTIPQPGQPGFTPPGTTPQTSQTEVSSVYLDADERTNRILMIGLPEQLDIVEQLISTLDVEQQDLRSMRLYEIQHVDADEVVKKLQELSIISTGQVTSGFTTRTSRTQLTGQQRPQPGAPPAGQRITEPPQTALSQGGAGTLESVTEEPQVVIIESTNSLLVNATAEQHLQIATIIGFVDSQPEQAAINYVVYPLENQAPEDLAKVLNDLIKETVERTDTTGKVEKTTTKRTEEDITILADKNTFSIIVYANKKNQQWIGALIKQLDKRRPQVLIDVTLVEISKNDDFTLDLDLVTKVPSIPTVLGTGVATPISLLSSDPGIKMAEASSIHGAGGNAFYADSHIQALLNAVNTKNYGRILAKPKLLVNDNEKGTINTSTIQTIVSPKTTVIPGAAGGNSTATVDVSMKEVTAEIKLEITPHISEGDLLRLEITMTRTDFQDMGKYSINTPDGVLSGPNPPNLLTSNVTTIITVPDQKTIILGGLEKLNQSKGGTKVPILGDVPIVGGLFRNVANKDTQNRLYVFIKANVLRPESKINEESDIVKISNKGRAEFEKHESEMQKYEDWPGIKPKHMDPNKILEKD
jgi:type II secretory pathway component GspD/PulD (secretin)